MIIFFWFFIFIFKIQTKRTKKKGNVKKFIEKDKILSTDINSFVTNKSSNSLHINNEANGYLSDRSHSDIFRNTSVSQKRLEFAENNDIKAKNHTDLSNNQSTDFTIQSYCKSNDSILTFIHHSFHYQQVYSDLDAYIDKFEIELILKNIIHNGFITLTDIIEFIDTEFTFKRLETPEILNFFIHVGECLKTREKNIDYYLFYNYYDIILDKIAFFLQNMNLETKSLLINEFPPIFTLIYSINFEINKNNERNILYVSLYYYIKILESLLVCDVSYFYSTFFVLSRNNIKLYKESSQFIFFRSILFFCVREILFLLPNFSNQYYIYELYLTNLYNKMSYSENNNSEEIPSMNVLYNIMFMVRRNTADIIFTFTKPENPLNNPNFENISGKIGDLVNLNRRIPSISYRNQISTNIELINSYLKILNSFKFFAKYFVGKYNQYDMIEKELANLQKLLLYSKNFCDACYKKNLVYILKKLSFFYDILVKNIFLI